MKVTTVDGKEVEIPMSEAHRVHQAMNGHTGKAEIREEHSPSAKYSALTHQLMTDAQKELREETGDFPENMKELFEFAVRYELFGDREDTHIMVNFLKVFYCMLQKETHDVQDE